MATIRATGISEESNRDMESNSEHPVIQTLRSPRPEAKALKQPKPTALSPKPLNPKLPETPEP